MQQVGQQAQLVLHRARLPTRAARSAPSETTLQRSAAATPALTNFEAYRHALAEAEAIDFTSALREEVQRSLDEAMECIEQIEKLRAATAAYDKAELYTVMAAIERLRQEHGDFVEAGEWGAAEAALARILAEEEQVAGLLEMLPEGGTFEVSLTATTHAVAYQHIETTLADLRSKSMVTASSAAAFDAADTIVSMRKGLEAADWDAVEAAVTHWRSSRATDLVPGCYDELQAVGLAVDSRALVAELSRVVVSDQPSGPVGDRDPDSIQYVS